MLPHLSYVPKILDNAETNLDRRELKTLVTLISFVTGGRWELNPQETCSTDMPDIPIVGTATAGAPGATQETHSADHQSATLPLEVQVQTLY